MSQAPNPRVTLDYFVFLTPYIYFISKSSWLYHQNISHFATSPLLSSHLKLPLSAAWTAAVASWATPLFPHLIPRVHHPHGIRVTLYKCKPDHIALLFKTLKWLPVAFKIKHLTWSAPCLSFQISLYSFILHVLTWATLISFYFFKRPIYWLFAFSVLSAWTILFSCLFSCLAPSLLSRLDSNVSSPEMLPLTRS